MTALVADTLLKMLDRFAKEAITNKPYDIDHSYIPYVYLIKIIPSAIVGIIVAVILRKVLISKHNDVKKAVEARLYTNGKIDFTVNKDSLVYGITNDGVGDNISWCTFDRVYIEGCRFGIYFHHQSI